MTDPQTKGTEAELELIFRLTTSVLSQAWMCLLLVGVRLGEALAHHSQRARFPMLSHPFVDLLTAGWEVTSAVGEVALGRDPVVAERSVVDRNAPHENRKAAIDDLAGVAATTQLRVIVVADGFDGSFRWQALNGLGRCRATTELAALADDASLPTAPRERADQLR